MYTFQNYTMKTNTIYYTTFLLFLTNVIVTNSDTNPRILSRHKRYVVFPEGSSLTVAFCITMNLITVRTTIFTQLVNFGINYDLPNSTIYQLLRDSKPESKETARRRHRRELYSKVEIILNAMGLDGKTCVYKALCEVVQMIDSRGENMLEEIIRRLFSYPLERMHYLEPKEHREYHRAHMLGHDKQNCTELFPNCHISLIQTLLGYSKINNQ